VKPDIVCINKHDPRGLTGVLISCPSQNYIDKSRSAWYFDVTFDPDNPETPFKNLLKMTKKKIALPDTPITLTAHKNRMFWSIQDHVYTWIDFDEMKPHKVDSHIDESMMSKQALIKVIDYDEIIYILKTGQDLTGIVKTLKGQNSPKAPLYVPYKSIKEILVQKDYLIVVRGGGDNGIYAFNKKDNFQ
jgi:hypothetical protein